MAKVCPLLLTSRDPSVAMEKVLCRKGECAWWIVPPQAIKDPPGYCAIYQIAEELRLKK